MSGAVAPAVEGVRLSLHVLAAAVWVGGQITLAGLVPAARKASPDVPGQLARAFARLSWPAFAVLVATGIWNVAAVGGHQGTAWDALLGAKLAVVALAGASAWLHSRATSRRGLAVWGALSGASSVCALVMGVFLAG